MKKVCAILSLMSLISTLSFAKTVTLEVSPILNLTGLRASQVTAMGDGSVVVLYPNTNIDGTLYPFSEVDQKFQTTSIGICASLGKKLVAREISENKLDKHLGIVGRRVHLSEHGEILNFNSSSAIRIDSVICR